jgi:GT2 family glycosyltransferase
LGQDKSLSIAVVIVTFKRYEQLKKTLLGLNAEGFLWKDIFIVDNNQGIDRREEFYNEFHSLNFIFTDENIASSGGFALGMQAAHKRSYDWVLLFNDDSRPKKGALNSFLNALDLIKDQNPGLIKIANLDNSGKAIVLQWKGVRKPELYPVSDNPVSSGLVTFDGCFISRRVMDKIGYCDPLYFMGTYEFDYCLKAKENQFGVFTIPNGLIEDEKLGSVQGTPPWRQYYNTRNHLHLGLSRKDPKIIFAWCIREIKFTYAILRFQNQKLLRLRLKAKATWHALKGKRGKTVFPK